MCFFFNHQALANNFAGLKIASYILSFYLIILAVIPCCALDSCPDDEGLAAETRHQPGDEDCGNCSPFFSCEGCATSAINNETPVFELKPITAPAVYTSYIQSPLPTMEYEYWLPPKLS